MKKATIIYLVLAILAVASITTLAVRGYQRSKAEKLMERAATRAAIVAAVDSSTRARLVPYMDSIGRVMATIKSEQSAIKSTILLNSRRNENLNRQIDSLNARIGVRPRF